MSLRRHPETAAELMAWVEERFRQRDADVRSSPTDVRYLYGAKGDVLFARGPADPVALGVPTSHPGGPGLFVIAADPSAESGAAWRFITPSGTAGGSGGTSGGGGGGGAGVTDHGALADLLDNDHPQYQLRTEKGAASGYASLDGTTRVPTAQLATGAASGSTVLYGDRTWAALPTAGHVIEDEGTPLTQRGTINFVGAGVSAADSGGKTVVTIAGGGGGGSATSGYLAWAAI